MLSTSIELDCRDAEPKLHLQLDGELAPEERSALLAHLDRCPRCRDELAMIEKTRAALVVRAERDDEAPAALLARITADTTGLARSERRARGLWAASIALAGTALVVAMVALQSGGAPPPEQPRVVLQSLDAHTLDVPVDIASPDARRVEQFLSPRVGARVRVPHLDAAGLSLAGARVVNAAERRAALLVYEDGLGARVSLLVVPDQAGALRSTVAPPTERQAAVGGVTLAGFVDGAPPTRARATANGNAVRLMHDGTTLWALVAAMPDDGMDRIASAILPDDPSRVAER